MPGPITHIALTDKVFNKYFKDKNKKDFFIGTSFPDIRYLKIIKREKTHFPEVKLNQLKDKNSFEAGFKFHSLVDIIVEEFTQAEDIYSLLPRSNQPGHYPISFLEDELFYNKMDNWDEIIGFLDNVLPEELAFDISGQAIRKWHQILQDYFSQKPNNGIRTKLMMELGFTEEAIRETNNLLKQIGGNQKINQFIERLYNNFELLLQRYD